MESLTQEILLLLAVINVTGQRTLDKKLAKEKPGYTQYLETNCGLIPLPPRQKRA